MNHINLIRNSVTIPQEYQPIFAIYFFNNKRTMSNLLFIDSFVLIKLWAVGFFGFQTSGIILLLLVISAFAFLPGFLHMKYQALNKLIKRKS